MKNLSGFTLAQLADFDEIIDVRTPSEFLADHIPGAGNYPVMDDTERARVGTIFTQESPFLAKKIGAAIVSRNIASHLENHFAEKPRNWKPLVYCWRGGKRSGSMTHILREIGWRAVQLEGGYKAYRKEVIQALAEMPKKYRFKVVCGKTGSGKSRLLQALVPAGVQILDLEGIAKHRGSVLGQLPGEPQPTQKYFESLLCAELAKLDPAKPVYIEAESKKIGNIRVPDSLLESMWQSECLILDADSSTRIQLLLEDYAHLLQQPDLLGKMLDRLAVLHGNGVIDEWKALIGSGQWNELTAQLIDKHYDAAYRKSTGRHYSRYADATVLSIADCSEASFGKMAEQIAAADA